ncbi:DUF1365 domain-containing protein [Emcibacter sp.]|uniref:DUF1365 domain-containing protein n=1 Tax=Emcibacter sp. TaxID=1979954 RepID=UPI002AA6FAD0|nr:DUF1365 domain-containing protein [Emcibacter sp.]
MISCLYKTSVLHLRHLPRRHEFRYSGFYFLFDLDELETLDHRFALFSHNRPNLVSFHDKDYGSGTEKPLKQHIQHLLKQSGLPVSADRILLLTMPRIWGYVFNPISIYYCFDNQRQAVAVIYEVNNTFGDRHSYVVLLEKDAPRHRHHCQKLLHVSPFFDNSGTYQFRNRLPDGKIGLGIRYLDPDSNLLFYASLHGRKITLGQRQMVRVALGMPWMTLKVIGAIHWQALKLWIKGQKVFRRPVPPEEHSSTADDPRPRNHGVYS